MRKKSKEDEQTLEELNLAHRCSQAKGQLVQTSLRSVCTYDLGQDGWILASFFFSEFMDLHFVSVDKHKKRTQPIFSSY